VQNEKSRQSLQGDEVEAQVTGLEREIVNGMNLTKNTQVIVPVTSGLDPMRHRAIKIIEDPTTSNPTEDSAQVWNHLLPDQYHGPFFNLNLHEWLMHNLINKMHVNVEGWETLFGVTAWRIWSGRNEALLADKEFVVPQKVREVDKIVNNIDAA
ncbi:polynucleotidyl transferase, partial [Striga asiatica]